MGKKLVIKGADFSQNCIEREFVQLDWVTASSKEQAVDLGIKRTATTKIQCEFSFSEDNLNEPASTMFQLMGCKGGPTDNYANEFHMYTYPYYGRVYGCDKSATPINASINKNTDKNIVSICDDGLYVGNEKKSTFQSFATTASPTVNICCFGTKGGTSYCGVKVHGYKVWSDYNDSSSLIMDLIPVKKKDGTVCFYNRVDDTYLYIGDGTTPSYGEL